MSSLPVNQAPLKDILMYIFKNTRRQFYHPRPTWPRRAGLPEESVLDLHAADLRASLQRVAGVTLEHRGVAGFPTVAAAAPILGDPRVVAGCCCGHWEKKTEEKVA